jgi:thiol-disulfide isomerase/thioredoxin
MRYILTVCLMLIIVKGFAQVKTIDMQQLQKRLNNKDTVYVVNFWATWCGLCVAELPNFEKLQKTYQNQPLKVLLISMDFPSKLKTEVIPFVKKRRYTAETCLASRKNDQEWIDGIDKNWSGALPATLIVNTKKGIKHFYEKEFTYAELNKLYQTNK